MMNSIAKILIMVAVFNLFGCKQKTANPNDIFSEGTFSVIAGKAGDKALAVGYFNTACKSYSKKKDYPWRLKISIALEPENLFENGLPKDN